MGRRYSGHQCRPIFCQVEGGIRDLTVTGVQTCALPISMIAIRAIPNPVSLRMQASTIRFRAYILNRKPAICRSHQMKADIQQNGREAETENKADPEPGWSMAQCDAQQVTERHSDSPI